MDPLRHLRKVVVNVLRLLMTSKIFHCNIVYVVGE